MQFSCLTPLDVLQNQVLSLCTSTFVQPLLVSSSLAYDFTHHPPCAQKVQLRIQFHTKTSFLHDLIPDLGIISRLLFARVPKPFCRRGLRSFPSNYTFVMDNDYPRLTASTLIKRIVTSLECSFYFFVSYVW